MKASVLTGGGNLAAKKKLDLRSPWKYLFGKSEGLLNLARHVPHECPQSFTSAQPKERDLQCAQIEKPMRWNFQKTPVQNL